MDEESQTRRPLDRLGRTNGTPGTVDICSPSLIFAFCLLPKSFLFISLHLWLFLIHLYLFDCAQGLKNNVTCVFSMNRISGLWELADHSCMLLTWLLCKYRAISNIVAFE